MGMFKDNFGVDIGDANVSVVGKTGPVRATWTLQGNGEEIDQAKVTSGDFTLTGQLPDGTAVKATVSQSMVGPTEVVIEREGVEVARSKGYVA